MKLAHDGRNRRTARLKGFDYTTQGAYFGTICTYARDHLFGTVVDGDMVLNGCGRVLANVWSRTAGDGRLPEPYDFVVMPNHVHGIVWLPRFRDRERWQMPVGTRRPSSLEAVSSLGRGDLARRDSGQTDASSLRHSDDADYLCGCVPGSLGAVIGSFKSTAAKTVNRARGTPGLLVWHARYHERIVRNEHELERIRQYILDNPIRWSDDPNNAA